MKRLLLILGVVGMVLGLSCGWFDWHNDIEYPVMISHMREWPGDSIILYLYFSFSDQTPDTSGVIFDWEHRGDTLWFLFQGTDGNIDNKGPYDSYVHGNLGVLDTGTYTLLFEGEKGVVDTFGLVVEDSLYRFVHQSDSGKVVYFPYYHSDTLRRIFPDMLVVTGGWYWSVQNGEYLDSLALDLYSLGAKACTVSAGSYSIFNAGSNGSVSGVMPWDNAFENGWLDEARSLLFTYDGDTVKLDPIWKEYQTYFEGIGFWMGNGYYRNYEAWENY